MARIMENKVLFRARDCLDVQWEVRGTSDPAPTITIYRSESPKGPWATIGTDIPENQHFYRDHSLGVGSVARRLYYRMTVHDGAVETQGDPFYLSRPPDGVVLRLTSKNEMILSRRIGEPCAFFVIRRLGDQCPACGSHGRPSHARCETCYGTGRNGGYYNPVKSMVAQLNVDQQEHRSTPGDIKDKQAQAFWTMATPYLNDGDMMQDAEGLMWKIAGKITRTTKNGHLMRQVFYGIPQARTDIIYDLLTELDAEFTVEKYYHLWKDSEGSLVCPNTKDCQS